MLLASARQERSQGAGRLLTFAYTCHLTPACAIGMPAERALTAHARHNVGRNGAALVSTSLEWLEHYLDQEHCGH